MEKETSVFENLGSHGVMNITYNMKESCTLSHKHPTIQWSVKRWTYLS